MTRPVFDWAESPGTSLDETPRVKESKFGDGFKQVAPDGLNPIEQQWQVSLRGVDNAIATSIVTFCRTNAGQIFDWTPLWATAPIGVRCTKWSRTQGELWGESDLSLTFEQAFEP